LNGLLGDIARALIEADVNVKLVMTLRDNIKKKVEHLLEEEEEKDANKTAASRTQNLSKIVQRTVVDELVGICKSFLKCRYQDYPEKDNYLLASELAFLWDASIFGRFLCRRHRPGWV
jgi:signal recognition particle GTPase